MGNCQAIDAAALVIQDPCGKQERIYWALTANEVMKMNPGHYVSLIIPLPVSGDDQENPDDKKIIRFSRVKLLRPTDTLILGRAYRLITTQEVMKVLRAKKHAKMKQNQLESGETLQMTSEKHTTSLKPEAGKLTLDKKAIRTERHQLRNGHTNLAVQRSRSWRPSLQSIEESGS